MQKKKPIVVIVDNSISFTGAFKCALTEAILLQDVFRFIFIVPMRTTVTDALVKHGFQYHTLPMLEISKAPKNLLLYTPQLFKNTIRLLKLLKKEQAAVVQVNDFYNLLGVAVKIAGFKGRLLTYVRFLPSVIPAPLRAVWISLAQRYADAIVAVSDAVLQQLPAQRKILRIYDAVMPGENTPEKKHGEMKKILFLYLSNYIRGKGQDYAIRAFEKVHAQNPMVVLKFAGGDMGLGKNRLFKNELQQYASTHGLSSCVMFESFTSDIESEIKQADVVLNFSEAESFSMTCAEASYYGVPVIATRCGGPEEIIVHEKTGLLVENRNVEQMQEAMLLLAGSPALRKQYGAEASTFVKAKFSAQPYVRSSSALLNQLVESYEA